MLGKEYCRLIIDRFEKDGRKHPSTVGTEVKQQDPVRSGTILFLHDHMDDWTDVVMQTHTAVNEAVHDYAAAFPMLSKHLVSGRIGSRFPRIERVDPGQGFKWHTDVAGKESSERALACLLYLSDVEEDGYTEFAHQGVKVQPEAGKIVVFPPYWTHMHRGVSPAKGSKYTMSFFWVYLDQMKEQPAKLSWRQRLTGRL